MRVLVFLHGTAVMHAGAVGRTRDERVAQVRAGDDPSVRDYGAYVPVGEVVAKLRHWQRQGAQIDYLSSHRNPDDIAKDTFSATTISRPVACSPASLAKATATWPQPSCLTSLSRTTAKASATARSPIRKSAPTSASASSRLSSPSSEASTISRTACGNFSPSSPEGTSYLVGLCQVG